MEGRNVGCDVFRSNGGHVIRRRFGEKEMRQNFVWFVSNLKIEI